MKKSFIFKCIHRPQHKPYLVEEYVRTTKKSHKQNTKKSHKQNTKYILPQCLQMETMTPHRTGS